MTGNWNVMNGTHHDWNDVNGTYHDWNDMRDLSGHLKHNDRHGYGMRDRPWKRRRSDCRITAGNNRRYEFAVRDAIGKAEEDDLSDHAAKGGSDLEDGNETTGRDRNCGGDDGEDVLWRWKQRGIDKMGWKGQSPQKYVWLGTLNRE